MEIINCPCCEKQISNEAPSCPHCGQPMQKEISEATSKRPKKKIPKKMLLIPLCVVLVGIIIVAVSLNIPTLFMSEREKYVYSVATELQNELGRSKTIRILDADTNVMEENEELGLTYKVQVLLFYSEQNDYGDGGYLVVGEISKTGEIELFFDQLSIQIKSLSIYTVEEMLDPVLDEDKDIDLEKINKALQ